MANFSRKEALKEVNKIINNFKKDGFNVTRLIGSKTESQHAWTNRDLQRFKERAKDIRKDEKQARQVQKQFGIEVKRQIKNLGGRGTQGDFSKEYGDSKEFKDILTDKGLAEAKTKYDWDKKLRDLKKNSIQKRLRQHTERVNEEMIRNAKYHIKQVLGGGMSIIPTENITQLQDRITNADIAGSFLQELDVLMKEVYPGLKHDYEGESGYMILYRHLDDNLKKLKGK